MDRDEGGEEEVLVGGNASARVVRVGRTVRKPWLPTTERTIMYLRALRQRGVDVPASYGRDDQGRLTLDFVPGTLAMDVVPLDVEVVRSVGALVRLIHDASMGLDIPADWEVLIRPNRPGNLLCHNDLGSWNLIIDGDRLVFIDWDGAGPYAPVGPRIRGDLVCPPVPRDEHSCIGIPPGRIRGQIRRRPSSTRRASDYHGGARTCHVCPSQAVPRNWPRAVGDHVRRRSRPTVAEYYGVHRRPPPRVGSSVDGSDLKRPACGHPRRAEKPRALPLDHVMAVELGHA